MAQDLQVEIIPFDRHYDRSAFSCGKPSLDEWLQRYAGQSERRDTTRTFLAIEPDSERVVGYYATTAIEINLDAVAAAFGVGRRRYPMPGVLIARLAVDREMHGRGVGKRLLVDALQRIVEASAAVGFEVVVVDAIDSEASAFYGRFGFKSFADDALRLFMTTRALRAAFTIATG
jgi:predicted N-acetyltransferase YhbS